MTINNFVGSFKPEAALQPSKGSSPFEDYDSSFIICTLKSILLFQYFEGHFITKELFFDLYGIVSPLTCATSLRINLKNPYLKVYQEDNQKSIVILSGHENGSVNLWENFETVEEIYFDKKEKKDPIVCIATYSYGIIIGTNPSTIMLMDFTFKNNIKTIELSSFGFKLFNYNISDMYFLIKTDYFLELKPAIKSSL